jgi:hypothetical protein
MMGTSILAVPWAMQQSGLAISLVIMFVMTVISLYTATIIIDLYAKHNSKCDFLRNLFLLKDHITYFIFFQVQKGQWLSFPCYVVYYWVLFGSEYAQYFRYWLFWELP